MSLCGLLSQESLGRLSMGKHHGRLFEGTRSHLPSVLKRVRCGSTQSPDISTASTLPTPGAPVSSATAASVTWKGLAAGAEQRLVVRRVSMFSPPQSSAAT